MGLNQGNDKLETACVCQTILLHLLHSSVESKILARIEIACNTETSFEVTRKKTPSLLYVMISTMEMEERVTTAEIEWCCCNVQ